MPKIVNKDEKINFICDEAYNVFVNAGIDDFSLNKFISDIKMSKGQFYHYFSTKEQLIYQVMSRQTSRLMEKQLESYNTKESFIDKISAIFRIYLNQEKYYSDLRKLYIDTLHIYITSKDDEIKEFNHSLYQTIFHLLKTIFEEEIKKGYFRQDSIFLAKSICATADGMFLQSLMIENFDLKTELSNYFLEIEKLVKIN